MSKKVPIMMKGTDKNLDYAVIAVKNGIVLGVKPLSAVEQHPMDHSICRIAVGFRVRGCAMQEDIGSVVKPSIMPTMVGKEAMKAFPCLPFVKSDERRASFDRAAVGIVPYEKVKELAKPESHIENIKKFVDKLYEDLQDVDFVEDREVICEFLVDHFTTHVSDEVAKFKVPAGKVEITKIDDKVTKVEFGAKPALPAPKE
jgi:hypothetical protein